MIKAVVLLVSLALFFALVNGQSVSISSTTPALNSNIVEIAAGTGAFTVNCDVTVPSTAAGTVFLEYRDCSAGSFTGIASTDVSTQPTGTQSYTLDGASILGSDAAVNCASFRCHLTYNGGDYYSPTTPTIRYVFVQGETITATCAGVCNSAIVSLSGAGQPIFSGFDVANYGSIDLTLYTNGFNAALDFVTPAGNNFTFRNVLVYGSRSSGDPRVCPNTVDFSFKASATLYADSFSSYCSGTYSQGTITTVGNFLINADSVNMNSHSVVAGGSLNVAPGYVPPS